MTSADQSPHRGEQTTPSHRPELLPEHVPYTGALTFALRSYRLRHDGSQIMEVAGLDRGEPVGFELRLGPEWKQEPHLAGTVLAIQLGTVTVRSIGSPSDALVRLLDRLFRTERQPERMKPSVEFIGLALSGDPAHLEAGTTRIKLTHEAGDDAEYFDLFTLIDLPSGLIHLREKDSCFRRAVVEGFRER